MVEFVTAQIMGAIAAVFSIIANQMKNKNKYILFYIISDIFFITNMVLLKAYSGANNTFILMILGIITLKNEDKKISKKIIILFAIILLITNIYTYNGIISLLPAIASYIYLVILLSEDMRNIRIYTMLSKLLWSFYDIIIKAYTTLILDLIGFVSSRKYYTNKKKYDTI